jgi:hypothetical protein
LLRERGATSFGDTRFSGGRGYSGARGVELCRPKEGRRRRLEWR